MAESRYLLEGAFHSRVYVRASSGEYVILEPDVVPSPGAALQCEVYQVFPHERSHAGDTYQVFREGRRRLDLEGALVPGMQMGTHVIIKAGANPSWEDIEHFKTQFHGTGCLVAALALPWIWLRI